MPPITRYVVSMKNLFSKAVSMLRKQEKAQTDYPIVPGGSKEAYELVLKATGSEYAAWLASVSSQEAVWHTDSDNSD